jgi:hypothetical protein
MKIACDCCRDGYVDFSLLVPRGAGPVEVLLDIALVCQVCHGTGEVDAEERIKDLKEYLRRFRVMSVQAEWEGDVVNGMRTQMLLNADIRIYGSDSQLVRGFAYKFDPDAVKGDFLGPACNENLHR